MSTVVEPRLSDVILQSICSNVRRLVFVSSTDSHTVIHAIAIAMSPFLNPSAELVVMSNVRNGNEVFSVVGEPNVEDMRKLLTHIKGEIIRDREEQTAPIQYFYGNVQSNSAEVSQRLDRIRFCEGKRNENNVFIRQGDLVMLVLNSQVHDSSRCCQKLEEVLIATSVLSFGGTLVVVADDAILQKACNLLEKHTADHHWKIMLLGVPALGPPSLEYTLTEASIASSEMGLRGVLPTVCAGMVLGALRSAPLSSSAHVCLVPVDIAINAALLSSHRRSQGDFSPVNSKYPGVVMICIPTPSNLGIVWGKVAQYVVDYYKQNEAQLHELFPEKQLLYSNPKLVFRPSLSSAVKLRGTDAPFIPFWDEFRSTQRKKEVLFAYPSTVKQEQVEALLDEVDGLWSDSAIYGGEADGADQNNTYPFGFSWAADRKGSVSKVASSRRISPQMKNPQDLYSSLLGKMAFHYRLLPYLSYVSLQLMDWGMYIRVITRAVILHMANYFIFHTRPLSSPDAFPQPRRQVMNFKALKESVAPTARRIGGSLYFYITAGLHDNGENHPLTPGITNHRITTILVQPEVRRIMNSICVQEGVSEEEIQKRARKILLRIGDTLNDSQSRLLGTLVYHFFARVYDMVEMNKGAVERLRCWTKTPRVQVVLVLLHRSYIDFLIMSLLLVCIQIPLPHVVSGEDFLRMGPIADLMRGTGAFFMRRSFRGDPLYGTLFKEYIRQLVLHKQMTEFFIEGMRSRTQKTLQPRMGILKFITDAFFDRQNEVSDILFVPISLSYDQLLEAPVYAKELLGIPKPKETVLNMLKGLASIKQEYGSIRIHVGEAISLQSTRVETESLNSVSVENSKANTTSDPLPFEKLCNIKGKSPSSPQLLNALSSKLIHEMERNVVVTTTSIVASALECLGFPEQGPNNTRWSTSSVIENIQAIKSWVLQRNGRVTEELADASSEDILNIGTRHLSSAIQIKENCLSVIAPENVSKMIIHMSTNQLLHLFIDEAVVSVIAHTIGAQENNNGNVPVRSVKREDMLTATKWIRDLFSQEFPSFTSNRNTKWMENAIARLQDKGGKQLTSIPDNSTYYRIPETLLSRFVSQFLFPQIEVMHFLILSLIALFTSLKGTHLPTRTLIGAIHKGMIALNEEQKLSFSVSCASDPIRHHLDSLAQLGYVIVVPFSGALAIAPVNLEQVQKLTNLLTQVKRHLWKSPSEDDAEYIANIVLQKYKETTSKSKI